MAGSVLLLILEDGILSVVRLCLTIGWYGSMDIVELYEKCEPFAGRPSFCAFRNVAHARLSCSQTLGMRSPP